MSFFRCFAVSLVLMGLASAPVLAAAPAGEDPEALIKLGNDLRRKGDDVRAEGYFLRAYKLAQTSRTAAQLGLVELAIRQYASAEQHLSEALLAPDAWVRAHLAALQDGRSKARANLMGVELVGAPKGAAVSFEDGRTLDLPADATLWLAPGAVSFKVQADGYTSAELKVTGKVGDRQKVDVAMPRLAVAPPPAPPVAAQPPPVEEQPPVAVVPITPPPPSEPASHPGRPLRIAGISVGAVGAASAVVGAVLLVQGRAKRERAESTTTPYDPADDNYATFENAGLGLLIGGGALIAGGVVMYIVGARAPSAEGSTSVSFDMTPTSAGIRWGGHF